MNRLMFGLLALVVAFTASCACEQESPVAQETAESEARLQDLLAASGLPDPFSSSLPPVADGASQAWLSNGGGKAVGVLPVARALWVGGASECARLESDLNAIGDVEEFIMVAASTPDEPTGEMLINLRQVTAAAIRACTDPAAFEPLVAEVAWYWTVADRRLRELGVET
jgi:hypothetical protein